MATGSPGKKTVLITGCSPGGIGNALAREFHKRGFHIVATARDPASLQDLVDLGMSAVALEVQSQDSILACRKQVAALCDGKLDILVNNAGRTNIVPATDISLPDVRDVFETNVFGVMAMCQAFMDLLIPARGLIINMASLAAVTPYVFSSVYCASKGALLSYSRTLRAEVRPFGVRVMVAMAGQVQSQLSTRLGHMVLPEGSLYKPVEEIYAARLAFSQKKRKMPPEVFARRLVDRAVAREVPIWLRTWFGRPDSFWGGGNSSKVWWGLALGEWIIEAVMYRMFGMPKIEKAFAGLAAKKVK